MMHEALPPPVTFADFSDVDAARPEALIAYLDAASRAGAGDKRNSYAAQGFRAGCEVLDLGCGTGGDVRAIAELVGPTGKVTGVDASQAMIAEARLRGMPPNAIFLAAPAGSLPFADGSFDAARAERVFLHLTEPEAAARELRRVLRANGTAFLLDPDWDALMIAGGSRELTRRITGALSDGMANPWAGRNACALLRRAGFEEVRSTPVLANMPLATAFELIVNPAIDRAIAVGAIDAGEGKAWLLSLLEADGRGEFLCGAVNVATLARVKP